jgi:hypothetical protein
MIISDDPTLLHVEVAIDQCHWQLVGHDIEHPNTSGSHPRQYGVALYGVGECCRVIDELSLA